MSNYNGVEIALIGMACQLPGADNVNEFWDNLRSGKESISFFTDQELLAAGIPEDVLHSPDFVKANACIGNKEYFDSAFFDYTPAEAKMMDPQFRLFHENCWKALEDAGYDVRTTTEKIGLFAGGAIDTNWENYCALENTDGLVDDFTASRLRNIGYLCSRISYSFDLRGPAVFLYTACSTSLVAVQKACMSLLLRECTMALAGGIRINNYTVSGYSYKEGMINSIDGHCRAFDEKASGFVAGEGVGVVLLKRLKDAIEDGDNIQAVIKGSAINNDGHQKISYTALSIQGQYAAILKAMNMARIEPESISYVEAHGTSTRLGDAIEVEALNLAFGKSEKRYCALGSVKSNIGHLDTAAGIAALIKTVLALKHRQIPPSLHFESPNPEISFNDSPFYVNTRLKQWESDKYPLRAGVSSFGVGGTNAHVVLEEASGMKPSSESRPYQILVWSAKTAAALERNIDNFLQYLRKNDDAGLPDIAYTLQTGRASFDHRKMIVCASRKDAIAQLTAGRADINTRHVPGKTAPLIVFVFSGRGSQYPGMCRDLYAAEGAFKKEVDTCLDIVKKLSAKDLKPLIFSSDRSNEVVLFIIEYALARLLIGWGITPGAMIGQTTGEYTAACIREELSLEDALLRVLASGPAIDSVIAQPDLGLERLFKNDKVVFIEVGQGNLLNTISGSTAFDSKRHKIISLVKGPMQTSDDVYHLLAALGELWLNRIEPKWKAFYENEFRKRVSLPTYSFEKAEYPVNVDAVRILSEKVRDTVSGGEITREPDVSKWFYVPSWKLCPQPSRALKTQSEGRTLIFADDCGVGDALIKKFTERGGEIICVRTGYRFMEESPFSYRINPGKEKEYKDLFERLFKHNLLPECIIHGWGITGSKEHELAETPSFALFYSLSAIVKAYLCKKLVLLTNDLHPVLDSEEIPYDKSLAPALLKVLSHEFPAVCTSHIDISLTDAMRDRLSDDLYSEILGGTAGKVISLRHGVRWEQFYDKVATDNIRNGNQSLREGGVYLITGGLGAVGSAIAAWLLKNQKAKVIVSGRTKLPVPEEQDTWLKSEWIATEVKTKIRRLQMLEKHGKVIYLEGNIADAARMEQLVKISEEIFGSITGVIHTAGIKSGSSINSVTALGKADFESQFEPKIAGLKVLKDIFGSKELNFCLLTSTIAAVTGGIGFGAYGPANSFMDYYIKAHRRLGELNNWVSVNFDGFDLEQNDAAGIRDSELPDMLSRILAATDYAQIVVSTTDLQKRLDRQAGRDASSDEVPTDVASEDDAIETTLLRLWRKLFGKPDMTPDDDYFEAGGDSLKALTLIGRIRDLHTVEVSIKEFFSRPTIRGLSEYIRSVKQADMPDLDADLIAATIRTHKGSPTNFEVI